MEIFRTIGAMILLTLYFLPTIEAAHSGRQGGEVVAINLFFGWTLIGWVVALAIGLSDKPVAVATRAAIAAINKAQLRAFPHCAEPIQPIAKVRRYSGRKTRFDAAPAAVPGEVSLRVNWDAAKD